MNPSSYVSGRRLVGVTSSAAQAIYEIQVGASVRIFPTSAGTATVYSTGSPIASAQLDVATGASAVLNSTNAKWTQWGAGPVSVDTTVTVNQTQTAIVIIVTSGTWIVEVTQ